MSNFHARRKTSRFVGLCSLWQVSRIYTCNFLVVFFLSLLGILSSFSHRNNGAPTLCLSFDPKQEVSHYPSLVQTKESILAQFLYLTVTTSYGSRLARNSIVLSSYQ